MPFGQRDVQEPNILSLFLHRLWTGYIWQRGCFKDITICNNKKIQTRLQSSLNQTSLASWTTFSAEFSWLLRHHCSQWCVMQQLTSEHFFMPQSAAFHDTHTDVFSSSPSGLSWTLCTFVNIISSWKMLLVNEVWWPDVVVLYCRAPPNHNLDRFNHTEVESPLWVYRDFNMLKRTLSGVMSLNSLQVENWYGRWF